MYSLQTSFITTDINLGQDSSEHEYACRFVLDNKQYCNLKDNDTKILFSYFYPRLKSIKIREKNHLTERLLNQCIIPKIFMDFLNVNHVMINE